MSAISAVQNSTEPGQPRLRLISRDGGDGLSESVARQVQARPIVDSRDQRPLGQILIEDGAVEQRDLLKALVMRKRQSAPLGEILLAHGWVNEDALTRALTRQWRTTRLDLRQMPPDPRLIDKAGADFCLTHGVVPWRRLGGVTWVATARPEEFSRLQPRLPAKFGHIRMLLCSETDMRDAILGTRRTALIRSAETRVPAAESCRTQSKGLATRLAMLGLAVMALGLAFAPIAVVTLLTFWAVVTLVATMALKLAAFLKVLRSSSVGGVNAPTPEMTAPLPVISVMVPLFAESDIADRLIGRLSRLTYPRELTDILLVVEESDRITCAALQDARLPRWIRVVTVPDGPIKTKPRALNYALNFCRGQIVGVWDAEDRPEPDQLHKVARHFHFADPDVACVQGILDYYNPRTNWLARCFTIEYAAWFRANLLGVAKLGLVVPLGGTTLFFRRHALEQVGCWDAWNVTEDADLGVRLARRGWRTEMIQTVTHEEANCRVLPWIKQRSRWLKGYAMTWGVHMRNPVSLWRDLGPRRFLAFQIQFLGTISQYLLAPVLWSFWLLSLGLFHPLRAPLGGIWDGAAVPALFGLFIASEILNIVVASWAVRGTEHRHLRLWVPTLHFYFPLGCLAGWKAIYEVVTRPFYWDKTAHGIYDASHDIETDTDPTDSPRYHYIPGDQIKNPSADIPGQNDALKERIELLGHVG